MIRKFLILFMSSIGFAATGCAAQEPRDTGGFYATTRNLRSTQELPSDAFFSNPGVDGVFMRISWTAIQPTSDIYDWAIFDSVARRAIAAGKKLSVGIIAGSEAPLWLEQKGVPFKNVLISRRRCEPIKMPAVWSEGYITAYLAMMKAVKTHLVEIGGYDALRIVKFTGVAQNTLELRIPRNNRCSSTVDNEAARWGYRPGKVVAAWSKMAYGVSRIYPDKLLVQPILQAQGFPAINDAGKAIPPEAVNAGNLIIANCIKQFGKRCGVQWNALKLQGRMAQRVLDARDQGATIGWQTNLYEGPRVGAGCQVDRRAATVPCNAATYTALLTRGITLGATFIEVWEPDMLRYPDAFATAAREWKR